MLPQVNSQLISITSGGSTEDWDQAAGAGAVKWSGNSGAYVQEKILTSLPSAAGGVIRTKQTSIVIQSNLTDASGDPLDIDGGDIFEFTWMGATHRRVVSDESGASLPTLNVQQYIRVHFTNEAPEAVLETE